MEPSMASGFVRGRLLPLVNPRFSHSSMFPFAAAGVIHFIGSSVSRLNFAANASFARIAIRPFPQLPFPPPQLPEFFCDHLFRLDLRTLPRPLPRMMLPSLLAIRASASWRNVSLPEHIPAWPDCHRHLGRRGGTHPGFLRC